MKQKKFKKKEDLNLNKYKIQFSKDARKDLIDTYSYIKYNLQEPAIAKKLIAKIREKINKLKDNSTIYAVIKDEIIKKRDQNNKS